MEIILKELRIKNFKGIIDLVVRFNHETFIHGANASGKTTIADAWYWLLFGKNSNDDKDFSIKNTVDTDRNREEHEVEGVLHIDGEITVLRRIYKEKWVKKRGEAEATYTGNENLFFWNDVPCQLKEFSGKIAKLMEESLFKLVTNPQQFNSIKWEERRAALIAMAGKVSDADVAGNNKDFIALLQSVGNNSLKEHKSMLSARMKKQKEELAHIPARIDELYKSLPDPEPDFATLQATIDELAADLNNVDSMLMNKSTAQKKFQDEQSAIHKEIGQLNRRYSDLQFKLRNDLVAEDRNGSSAIEQSKARIKSLTASIANDQRDTESKLAKVEKYTEELTRLRAEWTKINAEQFDYPEFEFDETDCNCPTCKQALPTEDINLRKTTMEKNHSDAKGKALTAFNNSKDRRLADNKSAGINTKVSKDNCEAGIAAAIAVIETKQIELANEQKALADLEGQYVAPRPVDDRLAEVLANNKEALSIQAAIQAQQALIKVESEEDNSELKARKTELANQLTELNKQLGQKEVITTTKNRITELKLKEKTLSQDLATAQREEHTLLQFEKARIDIISSRVNHKFKYVTFKMFNYTIEGGESPCCETMLDGVPYSDLNTAGRMKAGIDIINALCEHYGVRAPIFIDNRESVTEIPPTDSQVINLIVSPADMKLRVETASEMAEA